MGAAGHARRARRDHGARPRLRRLAVRPALGRPARDPRPARRASPTASGISGSSARRPCSPGSSSRSRPRRAGASGPGRAGRRSALAGVVCAMLLVPAVLLQVGLRDATEPWYFTNDSTYQIEIAGDLVLDGDNPYGHDYGDSGLERFYPAADDEEAAFDRAARHHFAYFPGTALTAAAWRLLPRPWDDYRLFVLLATFALLPAALLFPGPLVTRLAVGSGLAANPLIVHGAWFGTADAPALLALVLSFALVTRRHPVWAGASLGAAVALKQFALVAVPFLARHAPRRPRPARDALPGRRRVRGRLLRHGPPVPGRRSGRALGRHDRLRRRHVPHRRLRPRRAPPQPRRARRPLRRLPVPAARDPRLAADHGLAALEPVAR